MAVIDKRSQLNQVMAEGLATVVNIQNNITTYMHTCLHMFNNLHTKVMCIYIYIYIYIYIL